MHAQPISYRKLPLETSCKPYLNHTAYLPNPSAYPIPLSLLLIDHLASSASQHCMGLPRPCDTYSNPCSLSKDGLWFCTLTCSALSDEVVSAWQPRPTGGPESGPGDWQEWQRYIGLGLNQDLRSVEVAMVGEGCIGLSIGHSRVVHPNKAGYLCHLKNSTSMIHRGGAFEGHVVHP